MSGSIKKPDPLSQISGNPFIYQDLNGSLRYDPQNYEALIGGLNENTKFTKDSFVIEMGHGVVSILTKGSNPIIIEPSIGAYPKPVVDFSGLASSTPGAKPIIFFQSEKENDAANPTDFWLNSLRSFGYDIKIVTSVGELKKEAKKLIPDIVCFSGYSRSHFKLIKGYLAVKSIKPETITILGGYAATGAAANSAFDIVVKGEGDIILPLLLKNLQQLKAEGKIGTRGPIPWSSHIPGFAKLIIPQGFANFLKKTPYYPPQIPYSIATELGRLSINRYLKIDEKSGTTATPIEIGGAMCFRTDDGFLSQESEGLPGNKNAWPIPINEIELDILAGQDFKWDPVTIRHLGIYAQRGCRGENRCIYCSIQSPPGRRMSVDTVLSIVGKGKERGVTDIHFHDDTFIQDPEWNNALLDAIESGKLNQYVLMQALSRADTKRTDIIMRLLSMNMYIDMGLETLTPETAEKMGKVPKGKGRDYVESSLNLLEMIGEHTLEKGATWERQITLYMINSIPGDTIVDVAREIKLQLKLIKYMWQKYRFLPVFSNNPALAPEFGDRITDSYSGFKDSQPFVLPLEATVPPAVRIGNTLGVWHALGIKIVKGKVLSEGIYVPLVFYTDPLIGGYLHLFNIGLVGQRDMNYETVLNYLESCLKKAPPEIAPLLKNEVMTSYDTGRIRNRPNIIKVPNIY